MGRQNNTHGEPSNYEMKNERFGGLENYQDEPPEDIVPDGGEEEEEEVEADSIYADLLNEGWVRTDDVPKGRLEELSLLAIVDGEEIRKGIGTGKYRDFENRRQYRTGPYHIDWMKNYEITREGHREEVVSVRVTKADE